MRELRRLFAPVSMRHHFLPRFFEQYTSDPVEYQPTHLDISIDYQIA